MSDDRRCLDFLLQEMQRWHAEGRVPKDVLAPLYAEYYARWRTLSPSAVAATFDLGIAPTAATPKEPEPQPRRGLAAFLEERNIATLHIVGSLLLLAGLIALVQWQWAGWGRFILLGLLWLTAGGLMALGHSVGARHPRTGRALGLLGDLTLPLCGLATYTLVGLGSWLSLPAATTLLGGGTAVAYGLRLRQTQDPIRLYFLAAALLATIAGVAWLLPAYSYAALVTGGMLLAAASLTASERAPSEWQLPLQRTGHGLTVATLAVAAFQVIQESGGALAQTTLGLALLTTAVVYGLLAPRLELRPLEYASAAAAGLGALLLVPDTARAVVFGSALIAVGAVLQLVAALSERRGSAPRPIFTRAALAYTVLGGLPFVFGATLQDLPLAALLSAVALLWWRSGQEAVAAGVALLLMRLVAVPLDAALCGAFPIAPNEERWLLLPALALAFTRSPRLLWVSLGGVVWAGLAQAGALLGTRSEATAAWVILLVVTADLALWGAARRQPWVVRGALLPAAVVFLASHVRLLFGGNHWAWVPALTGTLVLLGWALRERADHPVRFGVWLVAAGNAMDGLLPAPLHDFWPLALLPLLLWQSEQEEAAEGGTPLRFCEAFLLLGYALTWLVPSRRGVLVDGAGFALTALAQLWRSPRVAPLLAASAIATATVVLAWTGYPDSSRPLPQCAVTLAIAAAFWTGLGGVWQRNVLLRHILSLGLALTGLATVAALAGLYATAGQGKWIIVALGLNAATLATASRWQRQTALLHTAFAHGFGAFALFFFDRFGLGIDRLDWLLLPVGAYLLLTAEWGRQPALRPLGLLLLLGPSLAAAVLPPAAVGHAILLVAECLAALALGIARRIKAYFGFGLAFLVFLLVQKLWEPLKTIHFGVYLTLLGVGVLAVALQFEKRREALRRWGENLREGYSNWE